MLWPGWRLWRMMTLDAYNFFLTFVLGVFQLVVVGRILISAAQRDDTDANARAASTIGAGLGRAAVVTAVIRRVALGGSGWRSPPRSPPADAAAPAGDDRPPAARPPPARPPHRSSPSRACPPAPSRPPR